MMKTKKRPLLVIICWLALVPNSSYAFAQENNPPLKKAVPLAEGFYVETDLPAEGRVLVLGSRVFGKVVKGAPYSATAVTEFTQTLGDGNQIVRRHEVKLYRDSEGRTRREQSLASIGKWTAVGDAPQIIYIDDPVGGASYNLDPRTRTARKSINTGVLDIKRRMEQEENRAREREGQEKRREQQMKERAEREEAQAKEREQQMKERFKAREARERELATEREKQLRERQAEQLEILKKRAARAKEEMKAHEDRLKEQEKVNEERMKEHEERARRAAKQHEDFIREQTKRHEELTKEHAERLKEQAKKHEAIIREHQKQREIIEQKHKEELKQFEKMHKEIENDHKEQLKRLEKVDKEIRKPVKVEIREFNKPTPVKEKAIAPKSVMKVKEGTGGQKIVNPDGKKKVDALGKQTIEGLEVEGTRATRTIAAGEIGNTLPIDIVDENWYSADLQLQVMTKHSDPRSGVTTYRLTNVQRGEPARSLFEVPADYTFVNGPAPIKKMSRPESAKPGEPANPAKPVKRPEPAGVPEPYI